MVSSALAMLAGNVVIYMAGVAWLTQFVGGVERALTAGVLPFLVGDLFKIALAALLLPTGWRLLGRR